MKRLPFLIMMLGLPAATAFAEPSTSSMDVHISTRPLQTVLVWALGKDPANVAAVELDIALELAKHGVAADRSSTLFPHGFPASADRVIALMRADHCDSVLAVRRTSTIHWEADDVETASLHSFLTHRAQLLNPKSALEGGSENAPIEVVNIDGNADWEIVQGEAIAFDLKSGRRIWRGNTQIKSAKDLPQEQYFKFLTEKVIRELETAGLIGPIKK